MIKRVMPELMGMRNIMVINDEAHHCYRAKPEEESEEGDLVSKEEREEAKENTEAARTMDQWHRSCEPHDGC